MQANWHSETSVDPHAGPCGKDSVEGCFKSLNGGRENAIAAPSCGSVQRHGITYSFK